MEDLLILGGVVAVALLLCKGGASASVSVGAASTPPGAPLDTPMSVSGGALIPGAYSVAPAATFLGAGLLPATSTGLATVASPPALPPPPPAVVGGAAGNAGTGGIPLGAFRLGVGPILPTTVPSWAGWLINHRVPRHTFRRVAGLSRVPVRFA